MTQSFEIGRDYTCNAAGKVGVFIQLNLMKRVGSMKGTDANDVALPILLTIKESGQARSAFAWHGAKRDHRLHSVTICKRMRATLKEIRVQLHRRRRRRRHEPVPVIGQWLNRLFRGYCNYYHVSGTTRRLDAFRREIIGAWRHALKRRSQRQRFNRERMIALARLFIPYPRELPMHPYPITRFGVKTQGRSRMR